jgi:cytochrome b6-f complex iron-sulfur subunit
VIERVGQVAAFVDDLLKGRRPQRFAAHADDADALRAAAALAAAKLGADEPSAIFAERLRRRLAEAVERPRRPSTSRRRLLGGLGLPAAAALIGAAVATGVREAAERLVPEASPGMLVPQGTGARWMPVASLVSLIPGQPLRFTAGAIPGFLVQGPNDIQAISAICTHMGCLLNPSVDGDRLDCACHGASFALDGAPLNAEYTRPLPRLRVRVNGDMVEVYAI